nr:hypothetical protein [uncultured Chryseobacterium sp.]
MNQRKNNPWNFCNTEKSMISPNGLYKAVYYNLNEIAMGAPLGGPCCVETSGGVKIKLHDWCGGPPVWEKNGLLLTIPVWTRNALQGTFQQIAVMDMITEKLTVFKRTFRVLDLQSFEESIIKGCDSPVYHPQTVHFNTELEPIDFTSDPAEIL